MKIWVIGRSYPLPLNNMQGSFELEQAKMLAKHGHEVSYIACVFHPFKKVRKWGYCNWKEDNISVYIYSQFYGIERMKLHLNWFQSRIWRKQLSRVESVSGVPGIIHVHYPANITVAKEILCFQSKGTRVICTEHWSQVLRDTIDSYERKQLKEYTDQADVFLCVGAPLKAAVKRITGTNRDIQIMPNIINDLFIPVCEKYTVYTFVLVGALIPIKQFDKVIKAFAEEFGNSGTARLMIVGGGPEANHLNEIAKTLNVSKYVILRGKLNRSETAKAVGKSQTLICYSQYETFGVPIIEAWGCGIPVIATNTAAVNEKWDEAMGVQVSPENIDELKQAMRTVFTERDKYSSEVIAKYARDHYSENTVYEKLMVCYSLNGGSKD